MNRYRERIMETPITEWQGASVEVRVFNPTVGQSMTSRMILDDYHLEDLKYLKDFPMGVTADNPVYHTWAQKRHQAERTVDMIAQKIAYDICRAMGKEHG